MRIVSLLPSATEILCALGLEPALVGVSHSCDFPPTVTRLPRVTRTSIPKDASSGEIDARVRASLARGESLYQLELERLDALAPDLIVTQSLCEVCAVGDGEVHRALAAAAVAPTVASLAPRTLGEVFSAILDVGRLTDRAGAAERLVASLRARVAAVARTDSAPRPRPRVAFLEWLDPLIVGGHWNPELVHLAGGVDCLGRAGEPSRRITPAELAAAAPDVICVAACGYGVEQTRRELLAALKTDPWRDLRCVRAGRVYAFDGIGLFSRPGPRLVESLELLAAVLRTTADPPGRRYVA
jgi:iron complex transport system substrate-binding protein